VGFNFYSPILNSTRIWRVVIHTSECLQGPENHCCMCGPWFEKNTFFAKVLENGIKEKNQCVHRWWMNQSRLTIISLNRK
jgi:hypothetical protein